MNDTNAGMGMLPCPKGCRCPECQIEALRVENKSLALRLSTVEKERDETRARWAAVVGERNTLESRLDTCSKLFWKLLSWADRESFRATIAIEDAPAAMSMMTELHAIIGEARGLVSCGASCAPQIPRMVLSGVCQLPPGHDGPHSPSVVERQESKS